MWRINIQINSKGGDGPVPLADDTLERQWVLLSTRAGPKPDITVVRMHRNGTPSRRFNRREPGLYSVVKRDLQGLRKVHCTCGAERYGPPRMMGRGWATFSAWGGCFRVRCLAAITAGSARRSTAPAKRWHPSRGDHTEWCLSWVGCRQTNRARALAGWRSGPQLEAWWPNSRQRRRTPSAELGATELEGQGSQLPGARPPTWSAVGAGDQSGGCPEPGARTVRSGHFLSSPH